MPIQKLRSSTPRASFFAKHSRLFAVLGAMIVFFTFVVRERLKEGWKNTADALDTAQYMYELHVAMSEQLRLSLETMDLITRSDVEPGPTTIKQLAKISLVDLDRHKMESLAHTWRVSLGSLERIETRIENLSLLAAKLPAKDPNRIDLQHLQAEVKATREHFDDGIGFFYDYATDEQWQAHLQPLQTRIDKSGSLLDEYTKKLNTLTKAIMEEAESIRRRNAQYATRAGWVSDALYILGWGLSLASKLEGFVIGGDD